MGWRHVLTAAAAVLVFVSNARSQTAGSIEGDIYLVTKNGDVKKGAGNKVHLLKDTPTFRTNLDSICSEYRKNTQVYEASLEIIRLSAKLNAGRMMDSLAKASADEAKATIPKKIELEARFEDLIRPEILASVSTGMEAHYKLSAVPAGKYLLFATTTIGDTPYDWWAAATVHPRESLHIDLDNSVIDANGAACNRHYRKTP
jgi:hypothetical protein